MSVETPRLKIPKPLGNETVSRAAFNTIYDTIDANAATRKEPEVLAQDIFASGFVVSGMVASKNATTANQLDVTAGACYVQQADGGLRRFTPAAASFTTSLASTTYYLDFQPDGTYSWGTAHSTQTGYLPIAEVTTDAAGNIATVTDKRPLVPGVGKVNANLLHGRDLAAEHDAHLADYVKQVPYGVATGSANTYAVTLSPAPTAYTEGMAVAVKINIDNTGASTININGLGAKSIKKPNGNDVAAGNLKAGSIYSLRYNGTNFILQGSDAAGNATPGDVLSGKTFSNDEGTDLVGTMPNRGAVIITPGTSNQTIAAGYHNGVGYVVGDANLVSANIKSGVSLFGVTGNLPSLKSIQTGEVSFSTDTTKDITISSVDINNAIVLVNFRAMGTGAYFTYYYTSAKLTSSTNLRLERGNSHTTYYPIVHWQVVEFEGLKSIQRGEVSFADGGNIKDITISSVDINNAIILVNFKAMGSSGNPYYYLVSTKLTSSTNLRLERYDSGSPSYYPVVCWQVVEY